jgi:uncharacterized protein YhbP (UPF0306 family)
MDERALATEIDAFLAAHHVFTLATSAGDAAHAASLMYAHEDFVLYWVSDPDTRHSREIEANSQVAATVAPDYTDFRAIRGLQIAGVATRLTAPRDVERARTLMAQRYSFLRELAHGPEALRAAAAKAGYYALRSKQITWIDNTRGFGHKETLVVR